jgi:hypothetical protein
MFLKSSPILEIQKKILLKHVSYLGVLSTVEREKFITTWSDLNNKVFVVKNIINDEEGHGSDTLWYS